MPNLPHRGVGDLNIMSTKSLLHQATLSEVAVAICINGISQSVMMASPNDLHDFALGFAITEGLISSPKEVLDIVIEPQTLGWKVDLQVLSRSEYRLKTRRRAMAGPSGCGLCGIESINEAMFLPAKSPTDIKLPAGNIIIKARDSLSQLQQAHNGIKGNHTAVYFDLSAKAMVIREDVGRHSALDKLIGSLYRTKKTDISGFVLLTSRCSHDLVSKMARAKLPVLVTLSQPTDLAVASANQAGLALFCFQQGQLKRFA